MPSGAGRTSVRAVIHHFRAVTPVLKESEPSTLDSEFQIGCNSIRRYANPPLAYQAYTFLVESFATAVSGNTTPISYHAYTFPRRDHSGRVRASPVDNIWPATARFQHLPLFVMWRTPINLAPTVLHFWPPHFSLSRLLLFQNTLCVFTCYYQQNPLPLAPLCQFNVFTVIRPVWSHRL